MLVCYFIYVFYNEFLGVPQLADLPYADFLIATKVCKSEDLNEIMFLCDEHAEFYKNDWPIQENLNKNLKKKGWIYECELLTVGIYRYKYNDVLRIFTDVKGCNVVAFRDGLNTVVGSCPCGNNCKPVYTEFELKVKRIVKNKGDIKIRIGK